MPKPSSTSQSKDGAVHAGFTTRPSTAKGAALTTKVRKVGRSSGVILAKDVLERYKLQDGDEVHVIEEQDGIKLMPYDPGFDEQMEAYRKGARKFRNALRDLAK